MELTIITKVQTFLKQKKKSDKDTTHRKTQ